MRIATRSTATLLFFSGFCALVYQVVWQREFRLIFGASTAASAAVLALFILGLGAGGRILGPRADRAPNPLRYYGNLEAGIALTAALSPFLLLGVRYLYTAVGGSITLGPAATFLRLALAGAVIFVPTFLMGGTLPAAARSIETGDDVRRSRVAWLYGVNTLGSVAGALLSTFVLLQALGNRTTIFTACLLNVLVALAARALAREAAAPSGSGLEAELPAAAEGAPGGRDERRAWFTLFAAFLVGAVFFLLEIVWYRMLGPILGGTVYTFGLITATALLGIGVGGTLYAMHEHSRKATLAAFGLTCALEALCIIVPFAVGDRIALLALYLQPLKVFGFAGSVLGWAVICAITVLPAALVAGYQFPLLIAQRGSGERHVGRDIGLVYWWNTAGAIAGALAGGFGLLPLLGAPGAWRLAALLLAALGIAAMLVAAQRRAAAVALAALAAVALSFAEGPTAVWRHAPIGVGHVKAEDFHSRNGLEAWMRTIRRYLIAEADGVESSVGLYVHNGLTFIVNGKSDGNARSDASTQVMGGLVGAALLEKPKTALVVGLGTGSTAGWLAEVPSMERVDVIELEPEILRVAALSTPVNHDVLRHPKVAIRIADAREVLLSTPRRYDIIFSEPSNPYRAGIASLFTREFYASSRERLTPHGLFLQWVQSYAVDGHTIKTVIATLHEVFPHVDVWWLEEGDLLLVASAEPVRWDLPQLRARLAGEPYRAALRDAWHTEGLEGFLARFLANAKLTAAVARDVGGLVNTDDRNEIEFGFAASLYHPNAKFSVDELAVLAHRMGAGFPAGVTAFDLRAVMSERVFANPGLFGRHILGMVPASERPHMEAVRLMASPTDAKALAGHWRQHRWLPATPTELALLGMALSVEGAPEAPQFTGRLKAFNPLEAQVLEAHFLHHTGRPAEAARVLEQLLLSMRSNPWVLDRLTAAALRLTTHVVRADPALAPRMFAALGEPLAVYVQDDLRRMSRLAIVSATQDRTRCLAAVRDLEPAFPWAPAELAFREWCYRENGAPEAAAALADLQRYAAAEPAPFSIGNP